MRFLYIKVLQIWNQMVDLMLTIVGHISRVSHVTGIFTQLWVGDNAINVPPTQTLGGRVPPVLRRIYAPVHVSLTVPEVWLFKVAIGRNAIFQILGAEGGKFQFFLTNPYKECERHQNALYKPLTTIIRPTVGLVAMRIKLKKTS